jgi:hypothetical protein
MSTFHTHPVMTKAAMPVYLDYATTTPMAGRLTTLSRLTRFSFTC